jgi:translation elongation factor EF-G
MMEYLEDQELDPERVKAAFYAAVRANALQPVLMTSATKVMGISLLLDFMNQGVRTSTTTARCASIAARCRRWATTARSPRGCSRP